MSIDVRRLQLRAKVLLAVDREVRGGWLATTGAGKTRCDNRVGTDRTSAVVSA